MQWRSLGLGTFPYTHPQEVLSFDSFHRIDLDRSTPMGSEKDTHEPGWSSDRLEQAVAHSAGEAPAAPELVLDWNGYPLRPQPSSDPQGMSNDLR